MQVTGKLVKYDHAYINPREATIELPEVNRNNLSVGDNVLLHGSVYRVYDNGRIVINIKSSSLGVNIDEIAYHIPQQPQKKEEIVVPNVLNPNFGNIPTTQYTNKIITCLTQLKSAIDDINKRLDEKEGK